MAISRLRSSPLLSTTLIAILVIILSPGRLMLIDASVAALEGRLRLGLLQLRCFARCLTYSPSPNSSQHLQWEPYAFDTDFYSCGNPACRNLLTYNDNPTKCYEGCTTTACTNSCQFYSYALKEPRNGTASFSPANPYLPGFPGAPVWNSPNELRWPAPVPLYPNFTVGIERGVVFLLQYAELKCGMDVDDVSWLTVDFPKESPSFDATNLKMDNEKMYVFRVASVNANGTRGFSPVSSAYSPKRQCIGDSPNIVAPASIDPSFLGFVDERNLEASLKVKWSAPARNVSSCYHVCVREKYKVIPELDVVCKNETLVAHTITTQGLSVELSATLRSSECVYDVYVSSIPTLVTNSKIVSRDYVALNSSSLFQAWGDSKPRFLRVRMFKTPDRRVGVTLTWSAPLNPPNILLGFQIVYGYNRLTASDWEEIARLDVDVNPVNGNYTLHLKSVEPNRDCYFRVSSEYASVLESDDDFVTTLAYNPPPPPNRLNVSTLIVDQKLHRFRAIFAWIDPVAETAYDYQPLGINLTVSVVGDAFPDFDKRRMNISMGTERAVVDDLPIYGSSQAQLLYMVEVRANSDIGPGSPASVTFHSPLPPDSSNLIIIAYVATPLVVFTIVVIVVGVLLFRRWKSRKLKVPVVSDSEEMNYNPMYRESVMRGSDAGPPLLPDEWEVAPSRIEIVAVLGEGYFGRVMKGEIAGQFGPTERHASVVRALSVKGRMQYKRGTSPDDRQLVTPVAVKMLKENATTDERRDLLGEIRQMKRIGFHSHIVSMLGCCTINEPICLVVEYVPYGDLLSFLRKNRQLTLDHLRRLEKSMASGSAPVTATLPDGYTPMDRSHKFSFPSSSGPGAAGPLVGSTDYADYRDPTEIPSIIPRFHDNGMPCVIFTSNILLNFGLQIALGMEYLSAKSLVHRDLACRNVLVDDNNILKISDFGLTRALYKDAAYVKKTKGKLPIKWMSIEAIFDRVFTTKSDVWSFGVVLWEICTMGGFPYPTITNDRLLPKLRDGYRMEKPENCSRELYDVMLECWHAVPEERPSFAELVRVFRKMLESQRPEQYVETRINEDKEYYVLPMDQLLGIKKDGDGDNAGGVTVREVATTGGDDGGNDDGGNDDVVVDDDDDPVLTHEEILSRTKERFRAERRRQMEMDAIQENGNGVVGGLEVELPDENPRVKREMSVETAV